MIIDNLDTTCDQLAPPGKRELAIEAQFILSAMDAAAPPAVERRRAPRVCYRVEATLHISADDPEGPPRLIYTRDLSPQGLGFISPVPFPLGAGAKLYLPAPGGGVDTIACNVIGCREMLLGWYDGAVVFKEETPKAPRAANSSPAAFSGF